jgi:HSP20 family protein
MRPFVGFNGGRRVPINVRMDEEAYLLTAAVPGLKKDDLQIEYLDETLKMSGEFSVSEEENGSAVLTEMPWMGDFSRSIRFPETVDADKIDASVSDGVLTIRVPKAEVSVPKQITVK